MSLLNTENNHIEYGNSKGKQNSLKKYSYLIHHHHVSFYKRYSSKRCFFFFFKLYIHDLFFFFFKLNLLCINVNTRSNVVLNANGGNSDINKNAFRLLINVCVYIFLYRACLLSLSFCLLNLFVLMYPRW